MPAAQEMFFGRTERTGEDSRSEFPYCATVAVGEGTLSTSIVGYQNLDMGWFEEEDGDPVYYGFPNISATFEPVAGDASAKRLFKLGDVKMKGLNAIGSEFLYQLNPENADPSEDGDIVYIDLENAKYLINDRHPELVSDEEAAEIVGWYDGSISEMIGDDTYYPLGTAFIGGDLSGENEISLDCAGQVPTNTVNIDLSGLCFPHFGNPIPRDVKLSEIICVGINAMNSEFFYQLNPATADPKDDGDIVYIDRENARYLINDRHPETVTDEQADEVVGWWDGSISEMISDQVMKAGECWIGGDLPGDEDVVISFPAGVKAKK